VAPLTCTHEPCHRAGWLFVRNLPGDVTAASLKAVFEQFGQFRKIRIMKPRSADARACAFVMYSLRCEAAHAVQMLSGRYEMHPGLGPLTLRADAPGVFVESLPDDVSKKFLKYIFSFYGRVRTVHVTTERVRGNSCLAFVEYSSLREVESARAALQEMQQQHIFERASIEDASTTASSGDEGSDDLHRQVDSSSSGNSDSRSFSSNSSCSRSSSSSGRRRGGRGS